MRRVVGVVGSCWIQQSNSTVGVAGPYYVGGPSTPNSFTTGGLLDRLAVSEEVRPPRVMRGRIDGIGDLPGVDQTIDDLDQRAAVAVHQFRKSPDGQTAGVIAQCGDDDGVERRDALQRSMSPLSGTLLDPSRLSSVHLFADVAGRASGDQIGEVVSAALADGENVVNVQHDVRRELPAVAARELVTLQDGPPNRVPIISGLPWVSHEVILAQLEQFAHFYQIENGVRS